MSNISEITLSSIDKKVIDNLRQNALFCINVLGHDVNKIVYIVDGVDANGDQQRIKIKGIDLIGLE